MNKKIILLLFACLVMLGTYILRFHTNNSLPFYEQYAKDEILKKTGFDDLLSIRVILFLISIINVWMFYSIFEKFGNDAFLVTVFWILSPAFIYFHAAYNPYILAFSFFLLGVLLVFSSKYILSLASLIVSCILHQNMFFVILLCMLLLLERQRGKLFVSFVGIVAVTYVFSSISNAGPIDAYVIVTEFFSDFGANLGFGIFSFILSVIGLIVSWENKKSNFIFYVLSVCLMIMVFFNKDMIFFLNVLIIYYSALGFKYMMQRKWDSEVLKTYVIIIFICGIMFSSGSFIKKISVAGPYQEELASFDSMDEEGSVFSHYKFGDMIRHLSGHEPFIDLDYYKTSQNKEKIVLAEKIFMSRDYNEIKSFFDKNDIKYVWINKEMTSGLVWKKEDEGMLLVLNNNFRRIYNYKGVEIWESS